MALTLLAAAVLTLAAARVLSRRGGTHPPASSIESGGTPVELGGDGVYFLGPHPTVRALLARAGHPCAAHAPRRRLVAGDRVRIGPGCHVRRDRMRAAARLTLGLPLEVDREAADGFAALPGVGPRLAVRIVRDRAARGPFGRPEGLLRVPGVGPATLARIRPYLSPRPARQLESVRTTRRSAVTYAGSSEIRDKGAW
jgi:helix-hairpin-helix protein